MHNLYLKHFLLGLTALFSAICSYSQLPANLQAGLVAFYPFCGNANDVTGNNNNGTVYNALLVPDRFGNANSAYGFDGFSSYIKGISPNFPVGNSERTTSQWFNVLSYPSPTLSEMIFSYGDSAQTINSIFGTNLWHSNLPRSIGAWTASFALGNDAIIPYSYSLYTWYNLVAVYKNNSIRLFLNGSFIGSKQTTGLSTMAEQFTVGKTMINNGYFEGVIDDIGVWGRALSDSEIAQLYTIGNTCAALPLKLLSFTAKAQGVKIALDWQTENEQSFSRFEIEKSKNGIDYQKVGEVRSNNRGSGKNSYSYYDMSPYNGSNFYRIKMLDKDGSYSYSFIQKIVNVRNEQIVIFPNPVKNVVSLSLYSDVAETIQIVIIARDGKTVLTDRKKLSIGFNNVNLKVSSLKPGAYNICLSGGKLYSTKSFLIVN